jgi:hypothetical protein
MVIINYPIQISQNRDTESKSAVLVSNIINLIFLRAVYCILGSNRDKSKTADFFLSLH